MLVHPGHPLAARKQVTMAEFARESVIAHNEASPARERVLRLFEQRHEALNIQMALPSLDAHQARGGDEAGRGTAAAPVRAHGAVTRHARGGPGGAGATAARTCG